MGFVTASMQVTARQNGYSLDSMRVQMDVTDVMNAETVEAQPESGVYINGLFMEGARWSIEDNCIVESLPKQLFAQMPVVHVVSCTVDKVKTEDVYTCPIFMTTIHGTACAPARTDGALSFCRNPSHILHEHRE